MLVKRAHLPTRSMVLCIIALALTLNSCCNWCYHPLTPRLEVFIALVTAVSSICFGVWSVVIHGGGSSSAPMNRDQRTILCRITYLCVIGLAAILAGNSFMWCLRGPNLYRQPGWCVQHRWLAGSAHLSQPRTDTKPDEVALLTFTDRENYSVGSLEHKLDVRRRAYCDRHGYHCVNYATEFQAGNYDHRSWHLPQTNSQVWRNWMNSSLAHARSPVHYAKLIAATDLLSKYKWVVWMDRDSIIANLGTPLETFLDDRYGMISTSDDSNFISINSGVFALNSRWQPTVCTVRAHSRAVESKSFLREWSTSPPDAASRSWQKLIQQYITSKIAMRGTQGCAHRANTTAPTATTAANASHPTLLSLSLLQALKILPLVSVSAEEFERVVPPEAVFKTMDRFGITRADPALQHWKDQFHCYQFAPRALPIANMPGNHSSAVEVMPEGSERVQLTEAVLADVFETPAHYTLMDQGGLQLFSHALDQIGLPFTKLIPMCAMNSMGAGWKWVNRYLYGDFIVSLW